MKLHVCSLLVLALPPVVRADEKPKVVKLSPAHQADDVDAK